MAPIDRLFAIAAGITVLLILAVPTAVRAPALPTPDSHDALGASAGST
jgi:hypothetical protein